MKFFLEKFIAASELVQVRLLLNHVKVLLRFFYLFFFKLENVIILWSFYLTFS